MELCGSNAFIEGKNLDNSRKLIGHYILQPEFIKAYLTGLISGVVVFVLFTYGLELPLPLGLLEMN